jgi:hypothetical protein
VRRVSHSFADFAFGVDGGGGFIFVLLLSLFPLHSLLSIKTPPTQPSSRELWAVDGILAEADPLEDLWNDGAPVLFTGNDRIGRPVVIERSGAVQLPRMMRHISRNEFFFRHTRHMELVERQIDAASKRFGPHVSQVGGVGLGLGYILCHYIHPVSKLGHHHHGSEGPQLLAERPCHPALQAHVRIVWR